MESLYYVGLVETSKLQIDRMSDVALAECHVRQ
jgi:hypothetical protein